MHDFLRAIGFSQVQSKTQEDELLQDVLREPTHRELARLTDDVVLAEFRKDYGPFFGIALRGEFDRNSQFRVQHFYPYLIGSGTTLRESVEIEKHSNLDAYAGICEDIRIGTTIIFYLQNVIPFFKTHIGLEHPFVPRDVTLTGLAKSGTILLPVQKSELQIQDGRERSARRMQLIAAAREGDEDAIENLTLAEIDTYTELSDRITREDILSIVDTTFMPSGIESDEYYVIGEIEHVTAAENKRSGETVYLMRITTRDVSLDICVSANDLLGEPQKGRRFKGDIWLQGSVAFEQ